MDLSWTLVLLSATVLVAYLFDLASRHIRVPSVVLLIFAGLAMRFSADTVGLGIEVPEALLPVLGTFGLILIVLEGSLDLSLSRDRVGLVLRSFLMAILGIVISCALITALIQYLFSVSLFTALLHAVPFAVISSAVAIPAATSLSPRLREFVVYESSFSDIFGVLLFYTILRYDGGGAVATVAQVSGEMIISIIFGVLAAAAIYWLIQRIEHHVRVLPMIFGVTLLYGLGKVLHLAPLVMVVIVGLLLNNAWLLSRISGGVLQKSSSFDMDLESFKHLTVEFTFVVRTFFFVLLGFTTQATELLSREAWIVAMGILACCILPRAPLLRWIAREKVEPLVWFAPRGLITVLLIISIPAEHAITIFPRATLMLVILSWALLLTFGVLRHKEELPESKVEAGDEARDAKDTSAPIL